MALPQEIERKFLVSGTGWERPAGAKTIRQAYLPGIDGVTVRVRQVEAQGYLTIKAEKTGPARVELEYEIPQDHAEFLFSTCPRPPLEKIRHKLEHDGMVWVVDEFLGANQGLILAEIELKTPGQLFSLPAWCGAEVSDDPRFRNSFLYETPFSRWAEIDGPALPRAAAQS